MKSLQFFRATLATVALVTVPSLLHAQFTLTSTDVKGGATIGNHQVFNGMGCTGDNVSPQLSWKGAPTGTKSFGITVYDPDAPTGSGWWHWMVYNLPASTTSLPAGAGDKAKQLLPAGGVQGPTDLERQVGAARVHRRGTNPIDTCSRCTRSRSIISTFPPAPAAPWWVTT